MSSNIKALDTMHLGIYSHIFFQRIKNMLTIQYDISWWRQKIGVEWLKYNFLFRSYIMTLTLKLWETFINGKKMGFKHIPNTWWYLNIHHFSYKILILKWTVFVLFQTVFWFIQFNYMRPVLNLQLNTLDGVVSIIPQIAWMLSTHSLRDSCGYLLYMDFYFLR